MSKSIAGSFRFSLHELSGALGDLGTLLPLALGAIAIAGLSPAGVFAGFGLFYLATAFVYRLPVPVQPMKAIAALAIAGVATPATLATAGVLVGLVLVALGATGTISRLGRFVPQSVMAGLQLGLGLTLAFVALKLMADAPAIALTVLAVLSLMLVSSRIPTALLAVAAAVVLGGFFDVPASGAGIVAPAAIASLPGWPSLGELERAVSQLVLPQLSLTLTNAILLTALLAGDYFGERASHVTPARLSLTSGIANIALAPFGALPMCHGAGGLAAHHRFGARTGAAPLLLGLGFAVLALLPTALATSALAAIPAAGLGALLIVAAAELAFTRRLVDSRPSCWPVIAVTALGTVWLDPFWGLIAGGVAEILRTIVLRSLAGDQPARDG